MARVFLLFVIVIVAVAVAITESKKGQGKKNRKPDCTKIGKGFDACLKKGYKSKGCKSGDGTLKKKDAKKCSKVAKAIKKCPDYTCPKPPPVVEPEVVPSEGKIQPPRTAGLDLSCKRDGFEFEGADITHLDSAGFEDCAKKCKDQSGCRAFTFSKSSKHCWLKNKKGGESGPTKDADRISMNIDCSVYAGFDASDRSCARDKFNFAAADLENFKATGFEECATACMDTDECKSFTLRKHDNWCHLKWRRGGEKGPGVDNDAISKNLKCDNSEIDLSCVRYNKNMWGADLGYFVVPNLESCAMYCRDAEACQAFTLRKSDSMCHMKGKRGGSNGPQPDDDAISMNLDCSPYKAFNASDMHCTRDNIDFNGGDFRDFQSSGYEDCRTSCFDAADCKAFSLRKSDNYCWLKNIRNGYWGANANGDIKSTTMEC